MSTITKIRHVLSPLRRAARELRWRTAERMQMLGAEPPLGTAKWLVQKEIQYGGIVHNVPRAKVSAVDRRTIEELSFGGMTGGDRMLHHGYAMTYSKFLHPFIGRSDLVVVEVGILKGSGLAIWADLFPDSLLIGLDIDPSHFENNLANLESRGAFKSNLPAVHIFDQLKDGSDRLSEILASRKIDILIDDGLHSPQAIANTLSAARPHLADGCVVLIEDIDAAALENIDPFFIRQSDRRIHVLALKS